MDQQDWNSIINSDSFFLYLGYLLMMKIKKNNWNEEEEEEVRELGSGVYVFSFSLFSSYFPT